MIHVNLLPEHLRPIKRTPIPYVLVTVLLVAALFVMASLFMDNQSKIGEEKSILAKNQAEFQSLQEVVNEYNRLRSQKEQLARQIGTIQEIVQDRTIWSRQLWNLSRLSSANMWYSNISVAKKSSQEKTTSLDPKTNQMVTKMEPVTRNVLRIEGWAIQGEEGMKDIGEIMVNMDKDPEFSSMFEIFTMSYDDNAEFEGYSARKFVIEYTMLAEALPKSVG